MMVEARTGYGKGVIRNVAEARRDGVEAHKGLWNLMLLSKTMLTVRG